MITQIILDVVYLVLTGWLILIPATPTLPQGLLDGVSSVFGYIALIGYFVPLDTLSAVLLIILAMYNIKILMDVLSWVLRKIPTMGG